MSDVERAIQTEFVNKLLVINGLYYAGMGKSSSPNRSEAVVIKSQDALHIILGAVINLAVNGNLDLRRIEIIRAKEASNG